MKKIIKRVFIVIPILLFITAFCFDNIKRNSVYYAKHTPHKEGTEPVLMMVVDNLEWIYNPEVKTLKYDFDGQPCVQFYTSKGKYKGFIGSSCVDDKKRYMYDDEERAIWLILDCNFNPEIAYDYGYKKIPLNQFDINSVKHNIYNLLQPIIDAQRKPKVNLQWLFDIVYKDKFN